MSDKAENPKVVDKELDDLLASTLGDFDIAATKTADAHAELHDDPPTESLWNQEFIAEQSKMFEAKMAELFGGGDSVTSEQLQLGFQRIAEAAALTVQPEQGSPAQVPSIDPQFTQSISDVLKGLSEGQDNLQQPFSADDISGMFGNIDLNQSGDNNPFLPFMQGMMQSLLSAEVLLPSLKDLVEKYPKWLEENGSKIEVSEKERYEQQLKLMQEVVGELEKEKAEDSADVKKDRFQIVLDRMQKMQDLGQPPSDLVGDVDSSIPCIPNVEDPSQCCLM